MAVANRRLFILLVGVDLLSQKMSCILFPNKKQVSWERGLVQMIQHEFPVVQTVITDRDVAIMSKSWQAKMHLAYGVDFIQLKSRSKAYAAERALRFLKGRLATALSLNTKGDLNWEKHLKGILEDYNSRPVKGSSIRRCDVNQKTVMKLLEQKYNVKDFTTYFNTATIGNFSDKMREAIGFKHRIGEKVLLSRSANYQLKSNAFTKKSVEGSYGKKVYTIEAAFLKTTAKQFYTIVYKLEGIHGIFYSSELVPALFASNPGDKDEDKEEHKKKLAKKKKKREQK